MDLPNEPRCDQEHLRRRRRKWPDAESEDDQDEGSGQEEEAEEESKFDSGVGSSSEEEDQEEEAEEEDQVRPQKRVRTNAQKAKRAKAWATRKGGKAKVWLGGCNERAYDEAAQRFLGYGLADRTRAHAAVLDALPNRPSGFMQWHADRVAGPVVTASSSGGNMEWLSGAAAEPVVLGACGTERGRDPWEDIHEADYKKWAGSNKVRSNRRAHLVAKLDLAEPHLGSFFPSLSVLAALEPSNEVERVCPNAAAGCRVVGKPSRRHTCKFVDTSKLSKKAMAAAKNLQRVPFQEGGAFAPKEKANSSPAPKGKAPK